MLVLKTELTLEDESTCAFKDTTGQILSTAYGQSGNIDYADVVSIRLKIGNYTTTAFPAPPSANGFIQFTEYQKTGGSPEVINNKTFTAGDFFTPQFSGITTSQPTNWETTGFYIYPYLNTWLPTQYNIPLNITVSQLGQSGTTIEDNEYIYEYEVYDSLLTTTTPAIVGTTYIVLGTVGSLSEYVSYNGNRYYAGEGFIGVDTSNIVPTTATFAKLYASTTSYATMVYTIETGLNDLIERQIGKGNQDLVNYYYGEIIKINTKLQSLMYSSKTNNVSLLYCWETIQYLIARINQLLIP